MNTTLNNQSPGEPQTLENSLSSTSLTSGASEPRLHAIVSRESFFAICMTVLLSALLYPLVLTGDPAWRFKLLEIISVTFFALTLLRSLSLGNRGNVEPNPIAPKSKGAAGLLVVLAVGALAYVTTIWLYFICDDFDHLSVIKQPFMQSIWPQITNGQTDGGVYIFYRPLGFLSLFVDFRLWHYWAPGYHLTNILLQLLCITGVFFFCKEIGLRKETCVAAALIFAVLPVNVQAVTWIGCRFDQLATTLGVWSLLFAARFRRTGRFSSYVSAILLFVLAVLSKENAYVIPLLWLALELIPQDRHALCPPFTNRATPLIGYMLTPLLMVFHRLHTLGGVAGYRWMADGSPSVMHFNKQALIGVIVHAPAETLFGYNWLLPAGQVVSYAAIATAVIFLMLSLLAKPNSTSRRICWFCLLWVFVAAIPAHFYFWHPDLGLTSSRAAYFGSVGLARLIAVLLGQVFTNPKIGLGGAFVIGLLLFVGLQHNAMAWRVVSQESLRMRAVLKAQPIPPHQFTAYYLKGVPTTINGVPFFIVGLESAVRLRYDWRDDIHVRTEESRRIESDAIVINWTPRQ